MTTYTVHFRNSTAWASHDVQAKTPKQALARARKLLTEDSLDLWFERYDATSDVNEIVVSDADGTELAFWFDEDTCLRLAASDMLEALEFIAADIEEGIRAKGAWLKLARDAIAKAKGGAP
jgi:hypothetical protein